MPTVEERLAKIEAQIQERGESRIAHQIELDRRLLAIDNSILKLTELTQSHVFKATCIKAGKSALEYGSMGGGIVAVVVLIGKLLNFW